MAGFDPGDGRAVTSRERTRPGLARCVFDTLGAHLSVGGKSARRAAAGLPGEDQGSAEGHRGRTADRPAYRPGHFDVHDGLLLSALWDAAFDRGLVTFDDGGRPAFSPILSELARAELRWRTSIRLTDPTPRPPRMAPRRSVREKHGGGFARKPGLTEKTGSRRKSVFQTFDNWANGDIGHPPATRPGFRSPLYSLRSRIVFSPITLEMGNSAQTFLAAAHIAATVIWFL